jgi:hypothetical protein
LCCAVLCCAGIAPFLLCCAVQALLHSCCAVLCYAGIAPFLLCCAVLCRYCSNLAVLCCAGTHFQVWLYVALGHNLVIGLRMFQYLMTHGGLRIYYNMFVIGAQRIQVPGSCTPSSLQVKSSATPVRPLCELVCEQTHHKRHVQCRLYLAELDAADLRHVLFELGYSTCKQT